MGVLTSALSITLGGFIGSFIKKNVSFKNFSILGICIAIISIVGFIENVFLVNESVLTSTGLYAIIFSLIIGYFIGKLLKLEERTCNVSKKGLIKKEIIEPTVLFAIGGLQITGPIILALTGDSSLLYLKSVIDFPLAIMFGAIYGKKVIFSAIPVLIIQVSIVIATSLIGDFFNSEVLSRLFAVGYVILFFSGFNMIVSDNNKIETTNMLPSILIVLVVNLIISLIKG